MDIMESAEKQQLKKRVAAISLSFLIGAALMTWKFYIYYVTDSSAVLSDALESIINVVASAFALVSVLLAAKPPDPSHPYGHGKIEYFSAGFEGALIVIAAVGIVWTAVPQILTPHSLPHLQIGLLMLLGAGAVNLLLGLGLVRVGKATQSLVLIADGRHILTDVYTSVGVLLGLFLVHMTDWYWLDGAIAVLVAINILIIGAKLVREAFAGLMDASDPKLLEEIADLLGKHRKSTWIDVHQLRAWRAGNRIHLDFHLILPRDFTLEQAHREVVELEQILQKHLNGRIDPIIHAEPCIDDECPICGHQICDLRQQPTHCQNLWQRDDLTAGAHREAPASESAAKQTDPGSEKTAHQADDKL